MKWKTSLSQLDDGKEKIRGYDLTDLVEKSTFVDSIFLLWIGRLPSKNESRMLNALFTSCIDHGVGASSTTVARTVASTGNSLHTALAAGITALGELHGGAIEGSALFLKEHEDEDASDLAKSTSEKKIRIPGFGHKVLDHDARADVLFRVAKETGFYLEHCVFAEKLAGELVTSAGKKIPLNIDGAMAAIILDMGIDPRLAKGFFLAGRVPGLIAHIYEEKASGAGLRRISEDEIEYTGEVGRQIS